MRVAGRIALTVVVAVAAIVFFWGVAAPGSLLDQEALGNAFVPPDISTVQSESHDPDREIPVSIVDSRVVDATNPDLGAVGERDARDRVEWERLPRKNRSIATLFAKAPLAVTEQRLLRHPILNAGDYPVSASNRVLLRSIISQHHEEIRGIAVERSTAKDRRLRELWTGGELEEVSFARLAPDLRKEIEEAASWRRDARTKQLDKQGGTPPGVSLDSLDSEVLSEMRRRAQHIVPGATAFLQANGRLFIAKKEQMAEEADSEAVDVFARASFLYDILSFFVGHGLMPMDAAAAEVAQFEQLVGMKPK